MPEETAAHDRRRLAAHRRPGDGRTRTRPTRSSPAARRCCVAAARTCRRPRSRTRSSPTRTSSRSPSSAVPSELTEDEVKAFVVAGARSRRRTSTSCGRGRRRGSPPSRCRGTGRLWTRCRARRPPGSPSTGCRRGTRPTEYDASAGAPPRHRGPAMTGYPTSIGTADETTIHLLGQDLAADLMGQVGFGELAFWLVAMRRPTPGELRVFEAVLVALADHGFTPDRDRRAAHAHRRPRVGAGRPGGRAARRRLALPRRHRGRRALPGRRAGRPRRRRRQRSPPPTTGWDDAGAARP